ncbi:baseplate hub assembly catalyst [Pseudomonas phage PspYZU05]|uniref:Baseplate hub assembly catalyst n=1 Tax=Pseudomonas phage PspYZU05 TaxID=1983556 RepID=A0A2U7NS13_9CAUD|nr:baseplate hub assembly catalyst [Pseudomonas phage PspYZU05]ASD52102.1 baseplate hub assembly catalyst [Pseudomonas phage PspYZU05]
MANIVRCQMPGKIIRLKPFNVSDYRDLLLIRNDLDTKDPATQKTLIDEMLEDYFGNHPESWRAFMFLKTYSTSIGKTKIPVSFKCPECGSKKLARLDLEQPLLESFEIESNGVKIGIKFPDKVEDIVDMILNNIEYIEYNGIKSEWSKLSDNDKSSVVDLIECDKLEEISKRLKPINITTELKCCSFRSTIHYDNMLELFKLLLNPEEIFAFYQINHMLVNKNYNLADVMNMMPVERSIYLSLIEKDLKKK